MIRFSIRRRITFVFIAVMTVVLVVICLINGLFLERYYVDQKLQVMKEAYEEINAAVLKYVDAGESIGDVLDRELSREWELWTSSGVKVAGRNGRENGTKRGENEDGVPSQQPAQIEAVSEEVMEELRNSLVGSIRGYSEMNNIAVVLVDSSSSDMLLSSGRESEFLARKAQQYVLGQGDKDNEILAETDDYTIERNHDARTDASYLESWGYFSDNNTLFFMQMPLSSIRESVVLSNKFTTTVGLIALVAGSILMYFVTRQVTNPILKLAKISERMSNLDFDVAYDDDAKDEIGVLGRSMNELSRKLKVTIDELKEANTQLQHDIEEKIQIDEMRKDFIANVSHELKTPIALIQGYAEGLTEGMAEDEESRNYYCEVISDEAAKMNKMVKQLLTLTALEFGNDAPVLSDFDINELIGDLLNSASMLTQQKEARVEFAPEEPLYVRADEFKIEEVLTNYLNNAMNHLDGERVIRIRSRREGDQVRVWVYNTGEHIPEEDIPNLWTKFYKVDKARTRAYGGSGIGLSIVKAIMDAHHQDCGVSNIEGGVEFWFSLEAVRAESGA